MAKRRYTTLDSLRGMAALAVVIYHLHAFNVTPALAPSAHLAVDFFFILSGFVVAHAYGEARLGRMSWRDFAARRLLRLMPLASLGAAFGMAVAIGKWTLAPGAEPPLSHIVVAGLLNLVMLPSFIGQTVREHGMFPGDGPLWSLFFELAVNLVWGAFGARLTTRQLAAVVAASAALLAALAVLHGSTRMGGGLHTFWGGAARSFFGFSLGVLLYRLEHRIAAPPRRWAATACVGTLVVAFAGPAWLKLDPTLTLAWDLAWIFLALPAVVVLGAGQGRAGQERASWVSERLGALSYPVYVLHWPCLEIITGLRLKLAPALPWPVLTLLAIPAVVAVAWAALRFYDEPLRRGIGRRLGQPSDRPGRREERPDSAYSR